MRYFGRQGTNRGTEPFARLQGGGFVVLFDFDSFNEMIGLHRSGIEKSDIIPTSSQPNCTDPGVVGPGGYHSPKLE